MAEPVIVDFHAHIYFDPRDLEEAQALAAAVQEKFEVARGVSISVQWVHIRAVRSK